MADRECVLDWLRKTSRYRIVHTADPRRKIVERLVEEGKAEWLSPGQSDRVRAKETTT